MDENPGQTFGEISRIVADRWRQMSDADKQVSLDCRNDNLNIIVRPTLRGLRSSTRRRSGRSGRARGRRGTGSG